MYASQLLASVLARWSAVRMLLLGAACALTFSLAPTPASAQFNGFGRGANQLYSGNLRVANMTGTLHQLSPKINIKQALEFGIQRGVEPIMRRKLADELPKKKKLGFTPYLVTFKAPPNATRDRFYVGTDLNGFTLRYVRPGAKATIGLHTPDVAFGIGLDRRANPQFVIPLDYELIIDVDTVSSSPAIRNVQIKFNAGRPEGANPTGKVAEVVNNLVSFLGGPDFLAAAQREVNAQSGSVTGPLGIQLKSLAPHLVAKQGGKITIRPQMAQDNFLILEVRKYAPPVPNLDPR